MEKTDSRDILNRLQKAIQELSQISETRQKELKKAQEILNKKKAETKTEIIK